MSTPANRRYVNCRCTYVPGREHAPDCPASGKSWPAEVHVARPHEIETYGGAYLDLAAPAPDVIALEDIAHALANVCRFGGHCRRFYSVAEHAVRVAAKLVAEGWRDWALAGLHHDDAEAYLGDIPRPLKPLLGDAYRKMTVDVEHAVWKALGRRWHRADLHSPQVKAADDWMLAVEARTFLPSCGDGWGLEPRWPVPQVSVLGLPPEEAKSLYLQWHHELVRERTEAA